MCVHGLQTDNMARVKVTGTHGCPWHAEPLAFKIFDCYFLEGKKRRKMIFCQENGYYTFPYVLIKCPLSALNTAWHFSSFDLPFII